jgi:hypothetical protein
MGIRIYSYEGKKTGYDYDGKELSRFSIPAPTPEELAQSTQILNEMYKKICANNPAIKKPEEKRPKDDNLKKAS